MHINKENRAQIAFCFLYPHQSRTLGAGQGASELTPAETVADTGGRARSDSGRALEDKTSRIQTTANKEMMYFLFGKAKSLQRIIKTAPHAYRIKREQRERTRAI